LVRVREPPPADEFQFIDRKRSTEAQKCEQSLPDDP
jgi:hypothetical protein